MIYFVKDKNINDTIISIHINYIFVYSIFNIILLYIFLYISSIYFIENQKIKNFVKKSFLPRK